MAVINKSEYLLSLESGSADIAVRYKEKIRILHGVDPFALTPEDLELSLETFPPVSSLDIVSYLLLTHSFYTKEQMKAYKSLSGYKYFEAGFVHLMGLKQIADHVILIGKVKHSQRMNNPPLDVWIICEEDGAVNCGHCTCMAGHSEVCSHVAALLFTVEHIHKTRTSSSCTDAAAQWNVPKLSVVPIVRLSEMELNKKSNVEKPSYSGEEIPAIEGVELINFLQDLMEEDNLDSVALARIVEPFASEIGRSIKVASLQTMYNVYNEQYESLNYNDLCNVALQIPEVITVEECAQICKATVNQNKSKEWYNQRTGRITASNFKTVCKTSISKPSLSLIKAICYPLAVQFKSKTTEWGINHQDIAISHYKEANKGAHNNFKVETCGLFVDPDYPFLGASPDAVVSCECCGKGCVEVKCPYVLKSLKMGEYLDLKHSCLTATDGRVILKREHSYFYQIQLQMKLTKSIYCDFIVWSPEGFFEERIYLDENFFQANVLKASEFHKKVILPELMARYFTKGRHFHKTWCICNTIDDGRLMLKCENDSCDIQWFHLECVELQDVPEDLWLCQYCVDI